MTNEIKIYVYVHPIHHSKFIVMITYISSLYVYIRDAMYVSCSTLESTVVIDMFFEEIFIEFYI